jgi:hypothetical protein
MNILSLAKECQKNPSLINLCKGHSQSLCKLALHQSGYTNGLEKWHGRYCFVVKHLLKVINSSSKNIKLKNGKKILDIIKSKKLNVPKDIQRFIQNNLINQKGSGDDVSTPETPFNTMFKNKPVSEMDKMLEELDKIIELEHRTHQIRNNLSEKDDVKMRQLKKLEDMNEQLMSLKGDSSRKIIASDYDDASFFDQKFSEMIDQYPNSVAMMVWPRLNQLLDEEVSKPRGSVNMKELKEVLRKISPHLLDALQSSPISGSSNVEPNVIGEAQSYFNPVNNDEIFINKNDIIKISTVYSNGKAYGEVLYTDKKGFFPLTVFMK